MRFILNFIFFGVLFYIIYLFFPEAFQTLVGWANEVYIFFRDLILGVKDKVERRDDIKTLYTSICLLNLF